MYSFSSTLRLVEKGKKMLGNVCLCHTSTLLYIHTIEYLYNLKENLCWILNFFPLWTILFSNKMEGKDGKLDINIDTVWNFLTRLIRIFFFSEAFCLFTLSHSFVLHYFIFCPSHCLGHVRFFLTYHYLYSYNLYYLVYWLVFYYNIFK